MQFSTRNRYAGTVAAIREGTVTAEVTVALAGGLEMVATITREAARRLRLGQGSPVVLAVKETDVLVATPD